MEFIQSELIEKVAGTADLFNQVRQSLANKGFQIVSEDMHRPWGGFFVIDPSQIREFKEEFFPELDLDNEQYEKGLSPKILLVAPGKRLSWQYHHRRSEVWKLIAGEGGIVVSDTDDQGEEKPLILQQLITLKKGERHRLVGKNTWGIMAEIWVHVDPNHPSDEDDIVRVEDDFARK